MLTQLFNPFRTANTRKTISSKSNDGIQVKQVSSENVVPVTSTNLTSRYNDPFRLFDDLSANFFGSTVSDLMRPYQSLIGMNSTENEDGSFTVTIDMPGVQQSDLSVEVVGRTISIKAERHGNIRSSYNQSFEVPSNYNLDSLKAELVNGVLTLHVSQIDSELQVKKIEVSGSTSALPVDTTVKQS